MFSLLSNCIWVIFILRMTLGLKSKELLMNVKSKSAGYLLGVSSMWSTPSQKKEKVERRSKKKKRLNERARQRSLLIRPAQIGGNSPGLLRLSSHLFARLLQTHQVWVLLPPTSALTHTQADPWNQPLHRRPTYPPPWMALLPRGLPGLQHCRICLFVEIWVCDSQNEVRWAITRRQIRVQGGGVGVANPLCINIPPPSSQFVLLTDDSETLKCTGNVQSLNV